MGCARATQTTGEFDHAGKPPYHEFRYFHRPHGSDAVSGGVRRRFGDERRRMALRDSQAPMIRVP